MTTDYVSPDELAETVAPVAPDELLVVVGETASGKTALALDLARRLGGEVVGADSVQVYRGFDIGSGKPTAAELGGVPHALLDVADPSETFDAARFVALADAAIAAARSRGRVPIVCGGTYLWVRALLFGLADAPAAPPELRARLQGEAATLGPAALHARLAAVDPASAQRLHPNDVTRVVRALEVHEVTGRPLSELQAEHGFRTVRHRARMLRVELPRDVLETRIRRRVDDMLARGLVEEVRGLVDAGHASSRAMGSVGYAEVLRHLRGELGADVLAETIARATRVFARRQRTWLKSAPAMVLRSTGR